MKITSSISILASAVLLMTSCSKSVTNYQEESSATTEKTASDAVAESLSPSLSPASVVGTYSLRGSRTQYRGQANDQGDNISVIFDYAGTRPVTLSRTEKGLTCGYCSDGFVQKGWMYIIRIDPQSKQILLTPNAKMLAEIQPNSFETLYASYDPIFKSFSFQTRYTATDGNENEVVDLLNKQ